MDKLEREIPEVMLKEWNEYLDYDLMTLTRAILGAVPAASQIGGFGNSSQGSIRLKNPDEISAFFEGLNKGNS